MRLAESLPDGQGIEAEGIVQMDVAVDIGLQKTRYTIGFLGYQVQVFFLNSVLLHPIDKGRRNGVVEAVDIVYLKLVSIIEKEERQIRKRSETVR